MALWLGLTYEARMHLRKRERAKEELFVGLVLGSNWGKVLFLSKMWKRVLALSIP